MIGESYHTRLPFATQPGYGSGKAATNACSLVRAPHEAIRWRVRGWARLKNLGESVGRRGPRNGETERQGCGPTGWRKSATGYIECRQPPIARLL